MKEKPNAVIVNGIIITPNMTYVLDQMQNEGNALLHEFCDNLDEMLSEIIVGPTLRTQEQDTALVCSVIYFKKLFRGLRAADIDPDTIDAKIELTT